MNKQKPWNEYEAVILLEAYVHMGKNRLDRKKTVANVSKTLRNLAVYNGIEIDEVFRNEAGISFQMYSMESAYFGKTIRKPATQLFIEIVNLRKKNKEKYKGLVEEARQMIEASNKAIFKEWMVSNGMTSSAARNYLNYLSNINDYSISKGISNRTVYEYENPEELTELYNILRNDEEFINNKREELSSLRKFIVFRSKGTEQAKDNKQIHHYENEKERTEYQKWLISTGLKKRAASNYGNWLTNLSKYAVENGICENSLYDYTNIEKLTQIYNEISKDKDIVSNHREYLTTLRSYIAYRSEGAIKLGRGRSSLVSEDPDRYEYQKWLVATGMKDTAARNYGNWLKRASEYAFSRGLTNQSLYQCDLSELVKIFELLCKDEELVESHRDYIISFKKYIAFRNDDNSIKTISCNDTNGCCEENNAIQEIEITDETYEHLTFVLNKYFEEGLVLNAIRLDKLRMLYEKEFKTNLSDNDEYLSSQLKRVGELIDGRVYPRHGQKQLSLLSEIINEISAVLNNGASCVYVSCVMQKWQQQLAEQLSIYNENALKDCVFSKGTSGIVIVNNVFLLERGKANPEKDILDYMMSCHGAVEYATLQKEIWYIPIDVIKHILVVTPQLVMVDDESYMYAPKFPASAPELQRLRKLMNDKIHEKGFLVSKDIADIIHEKCPTIALNTPGYKDWAYREVLRYLFKDYFEFGGSVVSEKGSKLEMWQVYRDFCRNHKQLSIDELKQFSDEVDVQIYWDVVLSEMVRINKDMLIRNDQIHFDIEAVDHVIEEICKEKYMPIQQIGLFLHFPTIEYPWNSFVLESYLKYSKKFELYHVSYSGHGVYGAVVRKDSGLADYRDVIVDMLARSNEWTSNNDALELIVKKGYQARRRYTGFDEVIQDALLSRERILLERK